MVSEANEMFKKDWNESVNGSIEYLCDLKNSINESQLTRLNN